MINEKEDTIRKYIQRIDLLEVTVARGSKEIASKVDELELKERSIKQLTSNNSKHLTMINTQKQKIKQLEENIKNI